MNILNKSFTNTPDRPVRIVQFGEGNFLRGFADAMIDIANEKNCFDGSVVLVKPTDRGNLDKFHEQDCLYTVSLKGIVNGRPAITDRLITCVSDAVSPYTEYEKYRKLAEIDTLRFVISNTTEAGIIFDAADAFEANPPKSFPGKLTKFLYERFEAFHGDREKGLIMLPVELIDDNGKALKECVMRFIELWNLGNEFQTWVEEACIFTSTLVDRIVTGYPKENESEEWERLGYTDRLIVTGEPFALWVIESEKEISKELPLPDAGLPVIYTDNHKPYKQRKVRILNGAHTSFVLASYLSGNDLVKESMDDDDICSFMMKTLHEEVIPTLSLPKEELEQFANDVVTRFHNPYVKHSLLAISLNSVSKWRARCMPSFLEYIQKNGTLPACLTFSLAALMAFYAGSELREYALIGHRNGNEYQIIDDLSVLTFFREHSGMASAQFVESFLAQEDFFGQNLNEIEGLTEKLTEYLDDIKTNGMRAALCRIL